MELNKIDNQNKVSEKKNKNWKKIVCAVIVVLLLITFIGTFLGVQILKSDETGSTLDIKTTELINLSTEKIKKHWKEKYKDTLESNYDFVIPPDGYLEIKNVRLITLKDEHIEKFDNTMEDYDFENIKYVVEYTLFSDYYGSHPYYVDTGGSDSVWIYKDGHMEVHDTTPFEVYRSVYYDSDFSGIIDTVQDFASEFNATYNLL